MSPFRAQHDSNEPNVNTFGDNAPPDFLMFVLLWILSIGDRALLNISNAVDCRTGVERAQASIAEFIRRVVGRMMVRDDVDLVDCSFI